jgi:hypothetical protein
MNYCTAHLIVRVFNAIINANNRLNIFESSEL